MASPASRVGTATTGLTTRCDAPASLFRIEGRDA